MVSLIALYLLCNLTVHIMYVINIVQCYSLTYWLHVKDSLKNLYDISAIMLFVVCCTPANDFVFRSTDLLIEAQILLKLKCKAGVKCRSILLHTLTFETYSIYFDTPSMYVYMTTFILQVPFVTFSQ